MSDNVVNFTNVTKKYLAQAAVNNISFDLPRGKITALVGPNGSGKSTILKMIAGLAHPSQGSVRVNGKSATRRIAGEVAYLSEKDVLYPFFTVQETIKFNAGLFEDFDMQKAGEILSFMGLEPDKKVRHLSKGNLGRLKILLVLSRRSPLILMDEPLAGLDPLARDSIIKSMISYLDLQEQTVFISTHEVSEVEPVLDMVMSLHNGGVKGFEEVEKIREKYGLSLLDWMKETLAN
ncbi:ABC transporter ATP-binding protein [Pelotomaculum propionicicum]|uniref:ABC transporter ATP-binding protein n=1 Tax=Pelotomaculum propionicicum TaxID=258475 RepID=UPI003B7D59C0